MSNLDERTERVGEAAREVAEIVRDSGTDVVQTAKDDALHVARTVRDAGEEVAKTAKSEATSVVHEGTTQARRVTAEVRQRLRTEADRQHQNMVGTVQGFAAELHAMSRERPQTPAKDLVEMLAVRSTSFAQYLHQHGPEEVLAEFQAFARRRPGMFIAAAVAAGFVAGRLGKGMWQNQRQDSTS